GGLDPADLFDALAHGVEVDGGHGLAGRDLHGPLDGGRGLGAFALDEDLLHLQPEAGDGAVDPAADRGADALGPRAGGEHAGEHEDPRADGDHHGARREVEPPDGGHLAGDRRGVARRAPAALPGGSAALCGLVRTLSPTAANYRGHEASSTIHRTRSRYPIPTWAACSGASEVEVMPGWVLTSRRTRTSLRSS